MNRETELKYREQHRISIAVKEMIKTEGWKCFEREVENHRQFIINKIKACDRDELLETRSRLKTIDFVMGMSRTIINTGKYALSELNRGGLNG